MLNATEGPKPHSATYNSSCSTNILVFEYTDKFNDTPKIHINGGVKWNQLESMTGIGLRKGIFRQRRGLPWLG